MRASPAFSVTVERFTLWRVALALWLMATIAVLMTWAWLSAPSWSIQAGAAALVLTLVTGWAAWGQASGEPWRLHWDRQGWHCARLGATQETLAAGSVVVAMDLGVWMLLRFTDREAGRTCWIAVQRRGLEAQWHALRCAVYSPRPEAGGLPDDPSDPLHGAASGASHRASSRTDPAA